jgi:hypothetical protein
MSDILEDKNTNIIPPVELDPQQDARLIAHGYEPIPLVGKRPVIEGWQFGAINSERIATERSMCPTATNTGLRTGHLVGNDIDVCDRAHAAQFVQLAEQVLRSTPLERAGSKGVLLVYRNSTPIRKITVAGRGAKIEILGIGQQFVAFGIHPDTNKPYRWLNIDEDFGPNDPLLIPFSELPSVTPDQLRDYARKAQDLLTAQGYGPVTISGDMGEVNRLALSPGLPVAEEVLRNALSYIDPNIERNEWRDIVAAIHAANIAGDNTNSKAEQIALEWSRGQLDRLRRYENVPPNLYTNDGDVLQVFNTMPPREGGITLGTLFQRARRAGCNGNPIGRSNLRFPDLTDKGLPRGTCENTRLAVEDLGIECRYDTFHDRMLLGGHSIGQWAGELSDNACLVMRNIIRKQFNFEPNAATMLDAARQLALRNQFDPVCDYFDGLKWNGVERLDRWLTDYLGAPDSEFVRAVGRLVLIAAVRRARRPGTKFDQIVVLEGPEGRNKSTAIKIMAGEENFSDQSILTETDKTQQELLKGVLIYEIADLTGISKADVDRVKAFASRTHDRARPAYGRVVIKQPRRCVLFATTNNDTYLQSQTGNRRFWPIKTGSIDIDKLRSDRGQLWAEAAKEEATGVSISLSEGLWPTAAQEQAQRLHLDPWTDKLAGVVGEFVPDADGLGYEERISSNRLFQVLNIPSDRATWVTSNRLKYVMGQLGWNGPDQMRIGRTKVRGYWRYVEKAVSERQLQPEGLVREVPSDFGTTV